VAQPKSAAQAIWGNLPSGARPEVEQRRPSLAEALYPSLVPKPPPTPNRYRESTVSLAQRCDEDAMFEMMLAKGGLVRKR
jgi:hypothetical protein